ncbi:MAG TPA: DUF4398 domain-containing protein [Kofleriaceae bacterium]|nr:DUF4398 domain-containing protein [Kofleriaceae bacterium]
MLVLAAAGACGPIEYVNQVTRKASASVEAARAAEADKYSPYYYTLAKEYLHKAREEAASADYQAANRFGKRAEEAADKARAEAIARAGKPIEMFHPNVVPKAGDTGEGRGTRAPAPTDMAPLVDDEELAPADDGDDEMPTMKGTP